MKSKTKRSVSVENKDTENDVIRKKIAVRIKQARKMAGFDTQKDLNVLLVGKYGWSTGRLGNYESAASMPGPGEINLLADILDCSNCWLMFGSGPIRSQARSLQVMRYQNLIHSVDVLQQNKSEYSAFLDKAETNKDAINKFINNPFRKIGDRQARRFEKALNRPKGWLDEQHVDIDPVCNNFPDEMRELMMIYSELDKENKEKLLNIARFL